MSDGLLSCHVFNFFPLTCLFLFPFLCMAHLNMVTDRNSFPQDPSCVGASTILYAPFYIPPPLPPTPQNTHTHTHVSILDFIHLTLGAQRNFHCNITCEILNTKKGKYVIMIYSCVCHLLPTLVWLVIQHTNFIVISSRLFAKKKFLNNTPSPCTFHKGETWP